MRKALPAARAEQHDVGLQRSEEREVLAREPVEGMPGPGEDALGKQHDAVLVALAVHRDVVGAVSGDHLYARGRRGVKLHALEF